MLWVACRSSATSHVFRRSGGIAILNTTRGIASTRRCAEDLFGMTCQLEAVVFGSE
jgi:hypothetical protein